MVARLLLSAPSAGQNRRRGPAGLERVLRDCARPPVALERLEQVRDDQFVYRFAKPLPDGRTELRLTLVELIDRLTALIPPHACAATAITACWHLRACNGRFRRTSLARPMTGSGRTREQRAQI